jgi:predicted glycogen debranching enzyme
MISFEQDICHDLDQASRREWLETNGLGGFASSTIAGLNTRRYHGLLVVATRPPVGRSVLLSKLEEAVVIGDECFDVSANMYPGVVYPAGHRYLQQFRQDPFPVFTYQIGNLRLEKSVFLVQGENTIVVRYRTVGPWTTGARLEVRPLVAFRDYHSTTHENSSINSHVSIEPGVAMIRPYEALPPLWFGHGGEAVRTGCWYRRFQYIVERERGLDFEEDLYNPLSMSFQLSSGKDAILIPSTEAHAATEADAYEAAERSRRTVAGNGTNELVHQLSVAASQFIVDRGANKTVIAGYHWFGDWGRDTMIALPGLTLATGSYHVARVILIEFARHVSEGMLPNRFPDEGETPEYNTVDATLWFFEAVRKYLEYTGDFDFVTRELYPVLSGIVEWHFRGTRHGIRVDQDGLLNCGEPGVQLTWMDAKIGDWVVTPRQGKPVEIQALWYNALKFMESLARRCGDDQPARQYETSAVLARTSFDALFWNEEQNCLYDVVADRNRDGSIRPNQIFAVSLPNPMISADREASVVRIVERELLTPFGLRTLAPSDPQYRPTYAGDPMSRDSAYHQGTVWPWLLGPFIAAYLKVHGRTRKSLTQASEWLERFTNHLLDAGLGQVSEEFNAEPPYTPGGCVAQAWSVAELLRAAKEDVWSEGRHTRKLRARSGLK